MGQQVGVIVSSGALASCSQGSRASNPERGHITCQDRDHEITNYPSNVDDVAGAHRRSRQRGHTTCQDAVRKIAKRPSQADDVASARRRSRQLDAWTQLGVGFNI
eukprot:CAMPEP_0172660682 /NCGR_PEP_ID=MMETSP1074-20121228/4197_1 /TAXON_ID=2916 /ORGANISM="Ceratium fusus, Strain PA161109" /LENGTH=104 /DNA_ID=CAMNT_0013476319 /DNA_START=72 /DNA_END=386 /DNA_ORIENTATION=+